MTRDFVLRPAVSSDLRELQYISGDARRRYASVPSLAHIVDSPVLGLERFQSCRIVVAVNQLDRAPVGFAMTRMLDQLLYLDTISVAAGASGRGIGAGLMLDVLAHARNIAVSALTLTTFREPVWNGPWFRRWGFEPVPPEMIGPELAGVVKRQAQAVDTSTRETLWLQL